MWPVYFGKSRKIISDFVISAYFLYFAMPLWAPNCVCKSCVEYLRLWNRGKRSTFKFGIPAISREPKNHLDDCYFGGFNVKGINKKKNRHKWEYPSAPTSVKLRTQHSDDVSVPPIPFTAEQILQNSVIDEFSETRSENDSKFDYSPPTPQRFSQNEFDDC
jgi:hypothetical protein